MESQHNCPTRVNEHGIDVLDEPGVTANDEAMALDVCPPGTARTGESACPCAPRRRLNPISVTLALSLAIALVYAALERVGTRANADTIEYTTNLAGGFLAVGVTDNQPGFVILSELDQKKVDVSADQISSVAAGTHTLVEIGTPQQQWQARLRKPLVIIVGTDGTVSSQSVDWSFNDFTRVRTASDCSHEGKGGPKRCGAPFADLHDLVSAGQLASVSDEVRAFLGRFQQD